MNCNLFPASIPGCNATDPNPTLGQPIEQDDARLRAARKQQVLQLYNDIFNEDSPQYEPQELFTKLKDAYELLETDLDLENGNELRAHIWEFLSVAFDDGCSEDMLERRLDLSLFDGNHPNLGPYLEVYNSEHFHRCALQFEARLMAEILEFKNTDLSRVAQTVRDLHIVRDPEATSSTELDFILTARGILEYLNYLGHGDEKPLDRSMNEHNQGIVRSIDEFFDYDCDQLFSKLNDKLNIYRLLLMHDIDINRIFKPEVNHLLDQVHICTFMRVHKEQIYPLAKYNLNELTDQILSTERSMHPMEPEKMRDLLEISLFVGQALMLIGHDNTTLLKKFRDLLTVGQPADYKCGPDYIRTINQIKQPYRNYPNLLNYLNHYGRLQMTACLPQLNYSIRNQISNLFIHNNCDSKLIDELVGVFIKVARDLEPNSRLHMVISNSIVATSMKKYLEENHIDLLNDNQEKLQAFKPKWVKLFSSCDIFAQGLNYLAEKFFELANLDTDPNKSTIATTNPNLITWITKFNVCKSIANMPPEIKYLEKPIL